MFARIHHTRKKNKDVFKNISRVNVYLQHRATEGDDVSIYLLIYVHMTLPWLGRTWSISTQRVGVYSNQMHQVLHRFSPGSPTNGQINEARDTSPDDKHIYEIFMPIVFNMTRHLPSMIFKIYNTTVVSGSIMLLNIHLVMVTASQF